MLNVPKFLLYVGSQLDALHPLGRGDDRTPEQAKAISSVKRMSQTTPQYGTGIHISDELRVSAEQEFRFLREDCRRRVDAQTTDGFAETSLEDAEQMEKEISQLDAVVSSEIGLEDMLLPPKEPHGWFEENLCLDGVVDKFCVDECEDMLGDLIGEVNDEFQMDTDDVS
jgi:hypothetical protein